MKTRIDYVTNSSTSNYLIMRGKVKGNVDIEHIRAQIYTFVEQYKLKFVWPSMSDDDKMSIERVKDLIEFSIYADIPFHIAIDNLKERLIDWFACDGVSDVIAYIHSEYEG